ncbi:MAG: hypothetical protein M3063_04295, partial [Actinomycetota bacterium]|nr:hypothetical protein [Actinomycetota bacterium]
MKTAALGLARRRGAGGRWCVGFAALVAAALVGIATPAGAAPAGPSYLDPAFGPAGTGVVTSSASSAGTGVAVVPVGVQGTGDIVVSARGGSPSMFQSARYTPTGTLDTTFGGGVINAFAGQANAVAVVASGTHAGDVVVAGYAATTTCGAQQPVVVEYLPIGTLDTRFNATGRVNVPCPGDAFLGSLSSVTLDASGNIVVAGQVLSSSGTLQTLVA